MALHITFFHVCPWTCGQGRSSHRGQACNPTDTPQSWVSGGINPGPNRGCKAALPWGSSDPEWGVLDRVSCLLTSDIMWFSSIAGLQMTYFRSAFFLKHPEMFFGCFPYHYTFSCWVNASLECSERAQREISDQQRSSHSKPHCMLRDSVKQKILAQQLKEQKYELLINKVVLEIWRRSLSQKAGCWLCQLVKWSKTP